MSLSRPPTSIPSTHACRKQARTWHIMAPSPPEAEIRFVLAHIQELSAKTAPDAEYVTSTKQATWCPVPEARADVHGIPSSATGDNLVAMWRAILRQPGQQPTVIAPQVSTPLIHIPSCRLDVDELRAFEHVKLERVALPRTIVQTLLSHMVLPRDAQVIGQPHFDDSDEWVYSRCLLADFSGMAEDEATLLSNEGRLCCWVSVVLTRSDHGEQTWDLCFVVHKILARRDPQTGRCCCS